MPILDANTLELESEGVERLRGILGEPRAAPRHADAMRAAASRAQAAGRRVEEDALGNALRKSLIAHGDLLRRFQRIHEIT